MDLLMSGAEPMSAPLLCKAAVRGAAAVCAPATTPASAAAVLTAPRYAASLPPGFPPEGLPLKVFTRLRPFTIVAAVWPNEPRLPQDICPPPRIELRLGALVKEKPLPSAALVIEPVVRLPLTAAWVAVTCVRIC